MISGSNNVNNKTRAAFCNELLNAVKNKIIENIIDTIIEDYRFELNGVVDINSDLAPEHYEKLFIDRLNGFSFLDVKRDKIIIHCPDIDTFDFSNGLEIIQVILEGIVGTWVEITGEDYRQLLSDEVGTVIDCGSTCLLKANDVVANLETVLGKKFRYFEFSNSKPKDIFNRAEKGIDRNIDLLVGNSVLTVNTKGVV